jgi:predicted metal-dependent hydrolase
MNVPLEFVRHARARRYVIRVRADGTVRVTMPRWGSKREAEMFARQQHGWIERQRQRVAAQERTSPAPAYSEEELRALKLRARHELPVALQRLAALHGLTVSRVSVRNQRWRWGSCSPKGHICLNWRLVLMPEPVREYVLIHELMHLRRLDHSKAYWRLVAEACPSYQDARKWLRANGQLLNHPMSG